MLIKKFRQALDLTQEELAKKIGVTQAAVAMWETGEAKPSTNNVIELAKVLGVTTDELLGVRKE